MADDDYIDPPTDEDDDLYDQDYPKKKVETFDKKQQINSILNNNKSAIVDKEDKNNQSNHYNISSKYAQATKDLGSGKDLRQELKPNPQTEKSPQKEVFKPFIKKPNNNKQSAANKSTEKLAIKSPIVKENKSPKNVKFEEDVPSGANYLSRIDHFEKNLKNDFEYNYKNEHDSDHEEEMLKDDIDPVLTDKESVIKRFNILKEKFKEKEKQIKQLQRTLEETRQKQKEFMDTIAKDTNVDLKEKKIIELAKKTTDLTLKNEKLRTQNKELEKRISEMQNSNQSIGNASNQTNSNPIKETKKDQVLQNQIEKTINPNNEESLPELKKKIKNSEGKIVELRNKNQTLKDENTKLINLLKKEIGDNIDLEKLLKGNEKVGWKGRAEMIEFLKNKVKSMESHISMTNSVLNSEDPKKLFLKDEKLIYKNDPKKEKEMLRSENEKLKEENNKILVESSRIRSRKDVLEKEIKFQKEDFTNKIKILLEKSDNDEKLIAVLNREMERLRMNGGNKTSSNSSGGSSNNAYNFNESPVFNLQQENAKLRKDLREKEAFINNLNSSLVNEGMGENAIASFSGLVSKLKSLEEENKALKQNDDNGKIYEQIAKENAKLRLKIRELEDKLNK